MNKTILISLVYCTLCVSCKRSHDVDSTTICKQKVIKTELDFAEMAATKGIKEAFLYYAAEDAVISRGTQLYKGKKAIKSYFEKQNLANSSLNWSPDFVNVSVSGDFAYTYGYYTYISINDSGDTLQSKGVFHTVWKKQKDGKWRFVWD